MIPADLQDTKEIPMRHLIMTLYESIESTKIKIPSWVTLFFSVDCFNYVRLELTHYIYYKYKKPANLSFKLVINIGKNNETSHLQSCNSLHWE